MIESSESNADRKKDIDDLTDDLEQCLARSVSKNRVKVAEALAPSIELILESRQRNLTNRFRHSSLGAFTRKFPWLLWAFPLLLALGLLAMLTMSIIGNVRWNRAIDSLRQEPGIEVIDARNPFFGKPIVAGLRDPKATDPASILEKNSIDVDKTEIRFAEYHSLNTAFAEKRNAEQDQRLNNIRVDFIEQFGDMVEAVSKVRRDDLETMTQAIFQIRFPEAAESAQIYLEDDQWYLKGKLEEPLFSKVIEELPALVLTGEVDTGRLLNTSQKRLDAVRKEIEETTFIFLSGDDEFSEDGLRQRDRMVKLVEEHQKLVSDLGVPGANFEVHALPIVGSAEGNRKLEGFRINSVEEVLKKAGIPADQILPGVHDTKQQEGRVGVYTVVKVADSIAEE